jgi:hypothetical protein
MFIRKLIMAMLVVGQLNAQNKPQIFINNIEEKYCAGQTIPFTISTNLKEKVEFNILISDYSGRSFESLKTTQKLNDSIVLPSDVILGGRYVFKVVVETLGVESDESTPFGIVHLTVSRVKIYFNKLLAEEAVGRRGQQLAD